MYIDISYTFHYTFVRFIVWISSKLTWHEEMWRQFKLCCSYWFAVSNYNNQISVRLCFQGLLPSQQHATCTHFIGPTPLRWLNKEPLPSAAIDFPFQLKAHQVVVSRKYKTFSLCVYLNVNVDVSPVRVRRKLFRRIIEGFKLFRCTEAND